MLDVHDARRLPVSMRDLRGHQGEDTPTADGCRPAMTLRNLHGGQGDIAPGVR